MPRKIPRVFISSTCEDLKPYRDVARDAAIAAEYFPVMQEYFSSSGRPVFEECMTKVRSCDVLVVIIAHRYGWVPSDQPGNGRKSITWLECLEARKTRMKVLAFIIDPSITWPAKWKEESNVQTIALEMDVDDPEFSKKIKDAKARVQLRDQFKGEINAWGFRETFTSEMDLRGKILQALYDWREHNKATFTPMTRSDPHRYLSKLRDHCARIEIKGLLTGDQKPHSFGIEELYIPLKTYSAIPVKRFESDNDVHRLVRDHGRVDLDGILDHSKIVITGEPGAGKTTYLRRIAFHLASDLIDVQSKNVHFSEELADTFPVFIQIGSLSQYIRKQIKQPTDKSWEVSDPRWLIDYMDDQSQRNNWLLDPGFFQNKFNSGGCIFLLDGLDEAPDLDTRTHISRLTENAVSAYDGCRFIVTTRPKAFEGEVRLSGFNEFRIDDLGDREIKAFLNHWSDALHPGDKENAEKYCDELVNAMNGRPEIRRMAKNPVMLTALATVYWNDTELPEERADLYESIITWLLRSRKMRAGRMKPEACRENLTALAMKMQQAEGGRKTQVGRGWAADAIRDRFKGNSPKAKCKAALKFLTEEEVDSGIITGTGNEIKFWHLSFMEYLVADGFGGLLESDQKRILVNAEVLNDPSWHEVLRLFAGVLFRQGPEKINHFFGWMLDDAEQNCKDLADQARCVGLMGAMLRDLNPVNFELKDSRYRNMLNRVMAIFDCEKARKIPAKDRVAAGEALGQAGDPRLDRDTFICIPGGVFWMGAPNIDPGKRNFDTDADVWDGIVRNVKLEKYRIGKYPVTVQEFQRFINENGYRKKKYWNAGGYDRFKAPEDWDSQVLHTNRPVVGVSWYEAKAYSAWMGCDLVSDAQWERAARGSYNEYRRYPWGNESPDADRINFSESNIGNPSPVGVFPRGNSREGVSDLSGNIWEWTSSFFETDIISYVVRGGSFVYNDPDYFRCSYRNGYSPGVRGCSVGFRVACSSELRR